MRKTLRGTQHGPRLLRDPLFKTANLLRKQGSNRDNEIVLKTGNLLRKKSAGGKAAPGPRRAPGQHRQAGSIHAKGLKSNSKTALQEHEVIPPLQFVFSYPISYSNCKREKGKGKKIKTCCKARRCFATPGLPQQSPALPTATGEAEGPTRKGGEEEGKGREEGRRGRSPLTCSAVPRARPAARPDRTPGMRPRYRRHGGQRAPAGAQGRKRAVGAAPEPPPPAAQPSPARPAPGCSAAAGDGMEPPEPGARSPGSRCVSPGWPGGAARRGTAALTVAQPGRELAAPLQFVPEFNKTGSKSLFKALGTSREQQSPPSLQEGKGSARSCSEPRWARARGQPLRTPPALPAGNLPVAFLSS